MIPTDIVLDRFRKSILAFNCNPTSENLDNLFACIMFLESCIEDEELIDASIEDVGTISKPIEWSNNEHKST